MFDFLEHIWCMYISFVLWKTTDFYCRENSFSRLFLQMHIK